MTKQINGRQMIAVLSAAQLFRMNKYKGALIWLNEASWLKGKDEKNEVERCYFSYLDCWNTHRISTSREFASLSPPKIGEWKSGEFMQMNFGVFSVKKDRFFRVNASSRCPAE